MKDFELAVSELLDRYRNRIPRKEAADALLIQYNLTGADETWKEEVPPDAEVEDETAATAEDPQRQSDEEFVAAAAAAAQEQLSKGPVED